MQVFIMHDTVPVPTEKKQTKKKPLTHIIDNHSVVFSQYKMNAKKIALVVLHVIWLA